LLIVRNLLEALDSLLDLVKIVMSNYPTANPPSIPDSTNFDTNYTRLFEAGLITDGFATLTAGTLSNLNNPVNPQDAATKSFVEASTGSAPGGIEGSIQFYSTSDTFAGMTNPTYLNWDAETLTFTTVLVISQSINNSGPFTTENAVVNEILTVSGEISMGGPISMNSNPILGLPGTQSADSTSATSKAYVDSLLSSSSLSWKNAVNAATTSPISLNGLSAIDGVPRLSNYRFLVKDQAGFLIASTENGIYYVASSATGTLTRTADANIAIPANSTDAVVASGSVLTVLGGLSNQGLTFICNTYGTDASYTPLNYGQSITFEQYTGPVGSSGSLQFNNNGVFGSVNSWITDDGSSTGYDLIGSSPNSRLLLVDNASIVIGSSDLFQIYSTGSQTFINNNSLNIFGQVSLLSTIPSTNSGTGSLVILGGLGLSGSLNSASLVSGSQLVSTTTTGSPFIVSSSTLVSSLYSARAHIADTSGTFDGSITGPITITGTTSSITSQSGLGTVFVIQTGPTIISPFLTNANINSLTASGSISAFQYTSTTTTGSPFIVSSTALVSELYVARSQIADSSGSVSVGGPITINGTTSSITSQTGLGTIFVIQNGPTIINTYLTGPFTNILTSSSIISANISSTNISAPVYISTTTTGTPFIVNSSALVSSLYVARSALADSSNTFNGSIIGPITITGTTSSITRQTGLGTVFVVQNGPTIISPFLNNASIFGTNGSTSSTTGALTVNGQLGLYGILQMDNGSGNGQINADHQLVLDAATGSISLGALTGLNFTTMGTATLTASEGIVLQTIGTSNILLTSGFGITQITSTIDSISASTGSLVIVGGLGIQSSLTIANTTTTNLLEASNISLTGQLTSLTTTGIPFIINSTSLVNNLYVSRALTADNSSSGSSSITGPITITGTTSSITSQTGLGTNFVVDTGPTLINPYIGFANGSTITLTGASAPTVNFLIVGGGGGGGGASSGSRGGGGGAGGLTTGSISLSNGAYTITIGSGGAGSNSTNGAYGLSSSAFGITMSGGGGGGGGSASSDAGNSGASGGGGAGPAGIGGSGIAGQGFAGATATNAGGIGSVGGGGGGAGGAGGTGSGLSNVQNGGIGIASSISGSSVFYAGGGGGATSAGSGQGGSGGSSVGGAGASGANPATNPLTAGSGGGGGTSSVEGSSGGNGGVVIISYPSPQIATGGTITTHGGNIIHTFNSSGTFTIYDVGPPLIISSSILVPALYVSRAVLADNIGISTGTSLTLVGTTDLTTIPTLNYLVIGGGGGGGGTYSADNIGGGGGGAGAFLSSSISNAIGLYNVIVGSGGAGGFGGSTNNQGSNGSSSTFASATAVGGGGGGGASSINGSSGASGGGAAGGGAGGSATDGFHGGNGGGTAGGGGGGSSIQGSASTTTLGGFGGSGNSSSISGSSVFYCGGGGGGGASSGSGGSGGSSIGGSGGNPPTVGLSNTGSGGGGTTSTGSNSVAGASGGSGVVILSYTSTVQLAAGGVITQSSGNFIHTFNSSGTFIVLAGGTFQDYGSASIADSVVIGGTMTTSLVSAGLVSTPQVINGNFGMLNVGHVIVDPSNGPTSLYGFNQGPWPTLSNFGLQVAWNYTNGTGETDFCNNSNFGQGGFNFYYINGTAPTAPTLISSLNSGSGWNMASLGMSFINSISQVGAGNTGNSTALMQFVNQNNTIAVGNIIRAGGVGSATGTISYSSLSDYRLKTNITDFDNSLDILKKLKVYNYQWTDASTKSDPIYQGFLAHEIQEHLPTIVFGEKDSKPDEKGFLTPQMMDHSKLTPFLTKTMQELLEEHEKLKESFNETKVSFNETKASINEYKSSNNEYKSSINESLTVLQNNYKNLRDNYDVIQKQVLDLINKNLV